MAHIINLQTFSDHRGHLTTLEKSLPFDIKRVFYLHGVSEGATRGEHRHLRTVQAAVCVAGSCKVYIHNGNEEETFSLTAPDQCLIIEANDWHRLYDFSTDAVLMVFASSPMDPTDYSKEVYTP